MIPGRSFAQELSGRFRFFYQDSESNGRETSSLTQNYNLRYRQNVNPLIRYLISVRYERTGLEGNDIPDITDRLLEPRFEATLSNEYFDFTAGYRFTDTERGATIDAERENFYSLFFYHQEKFPGVNIQFDKIKIKDKFRNDTDETRLLASSSYNIAGFSLFYNLEKKALKTKEFIFKRDSILHSANIQFKKSMLKDRANMTVGYFISDTRAKLRNQVGIPFFVEKAAIRGLSVIDDTPINDALDENAALIDDDTVGSAGIEIGGTIYGGGINRNIGLEFDPPKEVNTFFLWVSATLFPLSEDDFAWDLYTSDDNLNWTRVAISVPYIFDFILNKFEITVPLTTARFIKLVNTSHNPNEEQISVTEVDAFSTDIIVGERRDNERTQNINFNLNITPNEFTSITLSSFGSATDIERGQDFSESNVRNNSLTFFVQPIHFLSATAGYSLIERIRTFIADEEDSSYFLTFNANFFEAIDLSLGGRSRSVEKEGIPDFDAETYLFRAATQLYRDLDVSLDLGYIDQTDFDTDFNTLTKRIRFLLFTKPREEIILSADYLKEFITLEEISGLESDLDRTNFSANVTLRPSSLLNISARLLYQDLIATKGWSKIYRLDWLPFPGGAIQLNLSYETDTREITGETKDQARAGIRWNINRNTYLDLIYYDLELRNEEVQNNTIASALLEIRF